MPYPNNNLWSTVFSYLPEVDSQKLDGITQELAAEEKAQAVQHVFYPGISMRIKNVFIQFDSRINKSPNNTFKFHISIAPKDYEKVVYGGGVNSLLQNALVSSSEHKTLTAYKCVEPSLIKESQEEELKFLQGMSRIYINIKQFKKAVSLEEKKSLYQTINRWHKYVELSWNEVFPNDPFPQLPNLFALSLEELEADRIKHAAQFKVIQDETLRMVEGTQFTLYVDVDAKSEDLVALIKEISTYLAQVGVRPLDSCPESDLPLTDYVSFRQERYTIDGKYISAKSEDYPKLKEVSKTSEAYLTLSEQLVDFVELQSEQQRGNAVSM